MAKLIVALSLLVGGANAMGIYGTGRPTAEPTGAPTAVCPPCTVRTIKPAGTFFANSDNTCYVVDGTFPSGIIVISSPGVNCVKITVPSGSSLNGISAVTPPASVVLTPRPAKR